jgi:hypothetical protein
MNDADTLFREGRKTTQELDKAYQLEWDPWLDRLIASRIKPIDDPSFNVTSVELLNRRLQSGLTLREHIVAQAPNENIKRRLETVVEFGPEPMFLTNLFNLYTDPTSPVFKKPKALLSQAFLLDFFKAVTREERQAFVQRASDFLITAKNVISVHKLQILDGVGTGISAMKFAVEEFPVPGKEDNLANGYLAIWSQLHEVVAP